MCHLNPGLGHMERVSPEVLEYMRMLVKEGEKQNRI